MILSGRADLQNRVGDKQSSYILNQQDPYRHDQLKELRSPSQLEVIQLQKVNSGHASLFKQQGSGVFIVSPLGKRETKLLPSTKTSNERW